MVWAPEAIVALTSGVGSLAAGCPPQDARKIPMRSNEISGRRAKYIIHLMCELSLGYRVPRLIGRDRSSTIGVGRVLYNKYTLIQPSEMTLPPRSGYEQPTTIPQDQDFGARITVEASRSTIARRDSGEESKIVSTRTIPRSPIRRAAAGWFSPLTNKTTYFPIG